MIGERSLQIFSEVYRTGSIRRAAEQLYVSAQSVSKTIRVLEEELGEPLFVRSAHRLQPTPRAARLQRQAERILREFALIRSDHSRQETPQRLRVYCTSGVPEYLGPNFAAAFAAAHPELLLYLVELPDRQAQDLLRRDGGGTAILSDPCDGNLFDSRPLFRCGYCLVLPQDSPLCALPCPGPADLGNMPLVGKGDEFQLYINQMQRFTPDRPGPRVVLETTSYHLAMQMAAAGQAIAFVPDFLAGRYAPAGTVVRPYPRAEQEKRFYLVHPRAGEPTLAERAFARAVRRFVAAQPESQ